jgi:UDP-N-acetylmuramate dehydrogenase
MLLQEHVPLAELTTFKVGGPARYFARAFSESDVLEALEFAGSRRLPVFVLGGGSNLVISDHGFPGIVLKIEISGIEADSAGNQRIFDVGAGEDWDAFVAHTVDQNCAGVECLSGIPGTVGGTPVQNVGAYGQEVSQTIECVSTIAIASGKKHLFSNADCNFAYRTSRFNSSDRDAFVVISARYRLQPDGSPTLSYRDLKERFAGQRAPSLAEARDAVREIRHSKAMLIVPGDDDCRSAGSFFKNPLVYRETAESVARFAEQRGVHLTTYPATNGIVKLPAAWLVEQSGFPKGFTSGPVGISRRHSLAIVNRGNATATDIVALKNRIQSAVLDQFGIELKPEPVFVGFEAGGPTPDSPFPQKQ